MSPRRYASNATLYRFIDALYLAYIAIIYARRNLYNSRILVTKLLVAYTLS
jgi:hypothetical protein